MLDIIKKYDQIPFRYGADCCQFVGECIESVTGRNPMDTFMYTSEDEANAIIASHGSLYDAVCDTLGKPRDDGEYKKGDVALFDMTNKDQIVGVVYDDRAIVRTKNGLVFWPIEAAKAVWCT